MYLIYYRQIGGWGVVSNPLPLVDSIDDVYLVDCNECCWLVPGTYND